MYSQYHIIKIWENSFQNMNCFSRIKLIPVLIHLKYWYYNSPYVEFSCFPHHLCHILTKPTQTLLHYNLRHVLHWFLYFVLPHSATHHHKYWYTKPYGVSAQSNSLLSCIQITIPYGSNTLPIRKLSRSFIFTTLPVDTTIFTIFYKNLFLYFSQLSPCFIPLTFWQNHPYNLH